MSPKKYPVIDAQSAIANHNKNMTAMKDIEGRMNQAQINKLPMPNNEEQQPTLSDYLASNSLPDTFSIKSAMARKVGMSNYTGKPEQDKQIMAAMTSIDAKQGETKSKEVETQNKDKEFGLKNRELDIKEKEVAAKQMPDASSIADQLLNKMNSQQ